MKKGFTIIELLVTVTIIALLTGIILTNLSTSKSRSRDAKRVSDIAQLQLAFELYFDRCNQYPRANAAGSSAGPVTPTSAMLAVNNCSATGVTLGTFLSTIPLAPVPGTSYSYAVNDATTPTDYVLKAVLENNNQALNDSFSAATSYGDPAVTCVASAKSYCVQPR